MATKGLGLRQKLFNTSGNKVNPSDKGKSNLHVPHSGESKGPQPKSATRSNAPTQKQTRNIAHFFSNRSTQERSSAGLRIRDHLTAPLESWVVFLLTFLVGSLLLGGGIYLIFHGIENNIRDLIVVGGLGVFMGICFGGVGFVIFIRQILEYREEQRNIKQDQSDEQPRPSVQPKVPAVVTTSRISERRPSNHELYGEDNLYALLRPSSSSAPAPPQLAVPNTEQSGDGKNKLGVQPLKFRESTDDDIPAISHAASKQKLVQNFEGNEIRGDRVSPREIESRESTDIPISHEDGRLIIKSPSVDSEETSLHESRIHLSPDSHYKDTSSIAKRDNVPHIVVEEEIDDDDEGSEKWVGSPPLPPPSPELKSRVLSATNERKRATGLPKHVTPR